MSRPILACAQETRWPQIGYDGRPHRAQALLKDRASSRGKTFTAITSIYRLLRYAGARRVLFLVDTRNLGEQAEGEFHQYVPQDDNRKFTELYTVQRLRSSYVPGDGQVCISTIQRLYSILKGEPLEEGAENAPATGLKLREPLPVVYNPEIPPEFFDVIVIDECHRSIYNLWRQVIEYFDSLTSRWSTAPTYSTAAWSTPTRSAPSSELTGTRCRACSPSASWKAVPRRCPRH